MGCKVQYKEYSQNGETDYNDHIRLMRLIKGVICSFWIGPCYNEFHGRQRLLITCYLFKNTYVSLFQFCDILILYILSSMAHQALTLQFS